MEAWTARFGCGQHSLSLGIGRHKHALQKGQRLDQVLGEFSGDIKEEKRENVMRDEKDKLLMYSVWHNNECNCC